MATKIQNDTTNTTWHFKIKCNLKKNIKIGGKKFQMEKILGVGVISDNKEVCQQKFDEQKLIFSKQLW